MNFKGWMCAAAAGWLGVTAAQGQITVLGKTPMDKVLAGFWSQNLNSSNTVQGLNANHGTNKWANSLLPDAISGKSFSTSTWTGGTLTSPTINTPTITGGTVSGATYSGTIGLLTGGVWNNGGGAGLSLTNVTLAGTNALGGILNVQRVNYTALTDGDNSSVDFGAVTFVNLTSGPTDDFTIHGIAGGQNGRVLILANQTGYAMTLANESGTEGTAAMRIRTLTGAALSSAAAGGGVTLVYDGNASRWLVVGHHTSGLGTGNVTGPGSSTANAIARWNGTTGTALRNSGLIVTDDLRLLFGGSSGSFPAIKRAGTDLQFKTASDTSYVLGDMLGLKLSGQFGASNTVLAVGMDGGTNEWRKFTGAGIVEITYAPGEIIIGADALQEAGDFIAAMAGTGNDTTLIDPVLTGTITIESVGYSFPSEQAGGSGYVLSNDGSGNLSWAAAESGTTINPTTGYMPYRIDGTTFGDSPWYRINTNALGFNGTSTFFHTQGVNSLGIGTFALGAVTTGGGNTAVGIDALKTNTEASNNTAVGYQALRDQLDNSSNTAVGAFALKQSVSSGNTAVGLSAIELGTTFNSTSVGYFALRNAGGDHQTGLGFEALLNTSTGTRNTAVGSLAGVTNTVGHDLVVVGYNANAAANNNTNSVVIGSRAVGKGSNTAVIGADMTGLYLNGTVGWFRGTGSPEGVVTAPVGSYYTREDGAAGTSLYVKTSGSGNTGWSTFSPANVSNSYYAVGSSAGLVDGDINTLNSAAWDSVSFGRSPSSVRGYITGPATTFNLTADDFSISTSSAWLLISSDSATASDRTFKLASGQSGNAAKNSGWELTMEWSGSNRGEFLASGTNVVLMSDWVPIDGDVIRLVWNVTTAKYHERWRYPPLGPRIASATLDFPSTNGNSSSDLTITVTGAADGDVVSLGVPNAAVSADTCYTAWVSATDTVTVRFNNYSPGSANPDSATFKVKVFK